MFHQIDATDVILNRAQEAGFDIIDQHGQYFEVQFMGVVDRATLARFIYAMSLYGQAELRAAMGDLSEPAQRTLHS